MRCRSLFAMIILLTPTAVFGQDEDARALALAKDALSRGETLFDKQDASAMAATYIETAEIILIKRDSDSDRFVTETKQGRTAIEQTYADIFKGRDREHKCQNTIEVARFLGPDQLLIQGRFALNRDEGDTLRFVQIRVREGEQWKVATMQLLELPK